MILGPRRHNAHPLKLMSGPCSIEIMYPCEWQIAIPASLMRVDHSDLHESMGHALRYQVKSRLTSTSHFWMAFGLLLLSIDFQGQAGQHTRLFWIALSVNPLTSMSSQQVWGRNADGVVCAHIAIQKCLFCLE